MLARRVWLGLLFLGVLAVGCRTSGPQKERVSSDAIPVIVSKTVILVNGEQFELRDLALGVAFEGLPPSPRFFDMQVIRGVSERRLYRIESYLSGHLKDGDQYRVTIVDPPD
ncbi:MAG TPA: hypothetical protein DCR55_13635 [Lentisphaeria bacterium]|nr:hypothetical protein [Lentisphaeria bacterium]